MSKIRVLQSLPSMGHGGAEHFLMNLYRGIDKEQVQFDFLYKVPYKCAFDDEIESMGGRIYRVVDPDKRPAASRIQYRSLFRKHPEIRVVHEHRSSCTGFFGVMKEARRAKLPLRILHSHNSSSEMTLNPIKAVTNVVNSYVLDRYANCYFACSDSAGLHLYGRCQTAFSLCEIIPNAIDVQSYGYSESARSEIRSLYKIELGSIVIGHVGRFVSEKNQSFLLEVVYEILKRGIAVDLLMLGDGPTRDEINQKVKYMNISENVHFTGIQDETARYYSAMDVFCMPSLYEGLPVVCVEAQANGLPMVLSDSITRQVDICGYSKFVSLNDDVSRWADVVLREAANGRRDNEALLRERGYDIAATAERLSELYLSAI